MRIVKFKAGFGNQLFQYAFSLYLKNKFPEEEILIDYSWINKWYKAKSIDYTYISNIENLNTQIIKASDKKINQVLKLKNKYHPRTKMYKVFLMLEKIFNRKYYFEINRAFVPLNTLKKYNYFDGYWQSYKYVSLVDEQIRREFTSKISLSETALKLKEEIVSSDSVFIGIRLGDYLNRYQHWGSFNSEYFNKAIDVIRKTNNHINIFVFSNDIESVREKYNFESSVKFVDEDISDLEEFVLMCSCKHAIITNSTFHWWAAWLINNKNKIVVAPKKWFSDGKPIDIIPDEWVKI